MESLDVLITRFQQKDVKAFEQLHAMYAKNICGAIQVVVNNEELAQEICQDVFVKIWDKAETYDSSKGRFFTWLLNIARNAAIDVVRSKSFKSQKQNLSADFYVGILEQEDTSPGSEDYIGLKKLVRGLKKACVQLIEMLYFKGFTQKETAEALDIPIGTVKSRNRNCINALREQVDL